MNGTTYKLRTGFARWAATCALLLTCTTAQAVLNDDPADPDGDGFSNGEETLMGTNPGVADQNLSDIQLLTLLQKRAFDYFWLESKVPNYFAPDRAMYNEVGKAGDAKSIATTGFSLSAIVAADYNGWVDRVDAYNRVKATLTRLDAMQQSDDANLHKHGFFYHFVRDDGSRYVEGGFQSELSSIDHALLLAGCLLAAQYYKGTEVEALGKKIYRNTDWNFMFAGDFFYLAWIPDGGPVEGGSFIGGKWDRYSELMILLLQGMGSSSFPVDKDTWRNFNRPKLRYKESQEFLIAGPLFTHQFSHVWVDFREKRDMENINYHLNSVTATLVNRQFCIDLNADEPGRYETYAQHSWGLSAADSSTGYRAMFPEFFNQDLVEFNTDSGTVVPDAALSSVPFTPFESISAAQNWFTNFRSETFGRYGFRNAFNFGKPTNQDVDTHFPGSKIGLDSGTVATMIENFRTGLLWKFFGRDTNIQKGLDLAGFINDTIPSRMDFDDATPGEDPNAFGGFSGPFGDGVTSSYESLLAVAMQGRDVGGFVWKISSPIQGGGAFNGLNGKDISRFDTLSFFIRGDQGGESLRVGLKDTSGTEHTEDITGYIPGGAITTDFLQVKIPLRVYTDNKVRLTTMDNISVHVVSAAGGTVLIDDIAFIADDIAPAAPTGLAGTTEGQDIKLSWEKNTEYDAIGYKVFRAVGDSGQFVQRNEHLVLENSFTDSGALSDPAAIYHYFIRAVDNAASPNQSGPSAQITLPEAAPRLDAIGNKTVVAGNLLAFTVSATDPNDDPLTFSASNLPSGSSFSTQTRIFSWSPTVQQVGVYKNVRFTVSDGTDTDFEDITIAVTDNEIGTLDFVIKDNNTGQPVSGAIAFGTVGSGTGFTVGTRVIELSPFSSLNNWKVHIFTDNAGNANPFTGSGSKSGLIGETDGNFRVAISWTIFPAKVSTSDLPSDPVQWGPMQDKTDGGFGSALADRTVAEAGGAIGKFPTANRSATGDTVFLYLAADFTGAPAQAYSTTQLTLEMFQQ